jgi:hypothetical protein
MVWREGECKEGGEGITIFTIVISLIGRSTWHVQYEFPFSVLILTIRGHKCK